jgi:hypothetical protein
MSLRLKFSVLALIVIASSAILVFYTQARPALTQQVAGVDVKQQVVKLHADDKAGHQTDLDIQFQKGESAFQLMNRADTQSDQLAFKFKDFSFGKYLAGVNGVDADEKSEFWEFNVNGNEAQVGVSDYVVQPGDSLAFILTSFK